MVGVDAGGTSRRKTMATRQTTWTFKIPETGPTLRLKLRMHVTRVGTFAGEGGRRLLLASSSALGLGFVVDRRICHNVSRLVQD
nr:hypothetical protein Iba_chr02bCG14030 [Ipomoea batatas]